MPDPEECSRRGWVLAEVVRDSGQSGIDLDRPGIKRALQRIADQEVEGLIVAKLDRLSRSVSDFARLLNWFEDEAEAALVAIDVGVNTATPGGRLIASIFSSVAEWEAQVVAERTRLGLAAARHDGKPISRPAVADEPALARRIPRLRASGRTLQSIANALNKDGVPTVRGGAEWRPSAVQSVLDLRRPKRRGELTQLPSAKRRQGRIRE